ncbi:Hypothetical predicted protein, partial [Paramuricea clavata]
MSVAKNKRSAKELNNSVLSSPTKPSTKEQKKEVDDEVVEKKWDLESLFKLVESLNKKLDKLESIEAHLKHVDHDITELKHSLSYMHDTTEELKLKQTSYDDILLKNEEKIGSLEKLASTLKEELIDLRARSMRSNLMFYNLPENDEENPEKVVSE